MELIAAGPQKHIHYLIRQDANAGFYLYEYEHNRCVKDYLQDTLEKAKSLAFRNYHVSPEAWKEIDSTHIR